MDKRAGIFLEAENAVALGAYVLRQHSRHRSRGEGGRKCLYRIGD